ncbi:MAG TPA: OmpA family protein [Burkholderiales bacterium]|nr:OmpA family protein [Burkholderiales bacterium]
MKRSPLSLIAAALLAACASAPTGPTPLDQARASYSRAQTDLQVVQLAPDELNQAGKALATADAAQKAGESDSRVHQLAYLASQRVAIARETARQKSSDKAAADATAERERIRLQARTAEADAAQRAAAASKLDAEAAQRQAEASQRQADASQRQADASQLKLDLSQRQASDADARALALEGQLKELNAKKTERGLVITLGDVLFDTGRSELKSGGMRNVQKLADVLKEHPKRNVLIEGFTDSTGNSGYNQDLSDRRAAAVRAALQNTGVSADRITGRGYGQGFPVASNATAEGRQLNRRVEIVVSEDGQTIPPR